MKTSKAITISFDRDTIHLYDYILQVTSATDIKISGYIRRILLDHYNSLNKGAVKCTSK